jgi:ATP-dependent Zn protease
VPLRRSRSTGTVADGTSLLTAAGGSRVLDLRQADVGVRRERRRRRRLTVIAVLVGIPTLLLWASLLAGHPVDLLTVPHIDGLVLMEVLFFCALIFALVGMQIGAGRSPHVVFRPEQIDVRLDDVVGIDVVKDEIVRSLNLFLASDTFGRLGGTPRRGLLFEGQPGTGKTHTAKAMAAEAGVPFLFVSGTSFQSMYYGATARKIRSYFKALRKTALAEGGAIGFIEEIDAIGAVRGGMRMSPVPAPMTTPAVQCCGTVAGMPATGLPMVSAAAPSGPVTNGYMSEGVSGVVNELLVQMQSFDNPTGLAKLVTRMVNAVNLLLPLHRQLSAPAAARPNILLIAATNRADHLDPALLRPGRFDRALTFEAPDKVGRRALVDHFLARKAHHDAEFDEEHRDALAAVTQGYTPVRIEQLMDEALVNAVRRGDTAMTWKDVEHARLVIDVGLGQPVGYTEHEARLIATHEAGHATAAWLVAPERRLEVLTIIKRREALGLLAHGDAEDVYTRSRAEMLALIQIAMAGQCAEEIFFGDVSTGPSGDLMYATHVAAQMVGAAGMTDSLVSFAAVQGNTFSDTNIVGRVLGDGDGRRRVEELLSEQKLAIKGRLEAEPHLVAALRDELLTRHELIGHEITDVLSAARAAHVDEGPLVPVPAAPAAVIDLRDAARLDPLGAEQSAS